MLRRRVTKSHRQRQKQNLTQFTACGNNVVVYLSYSLVLYSRRIGGAVAETKPSLRFTANSERSLLVD